MPYVMQLFEHPGTAPQYLEWFDVDDPGVYPTGTVQYTAQIRRALKFATRLDALDAWNTQSTAVPFRPDGRPNKPLTAFTVNILYVDDECMLEV